MDFRGSGSPRLESVRLRRRFLAPASEAAQALSSGGLAAASLRGSRHLRNFHTPAAQFRMNLPFHYFPLSQAQAKPKPKSVDLHGIQETISQQAATPRGSRVPYLGNRKANSSVV